LFRSLFDALPNALEFDCLMIALPGREDGQIELTSLSDGTSPEEHTSLLQKSRGTELGGSRIYSAAEGDSAFPFAAEHRFPN
jgi:hypothetical protein